MNYAELGCACGERSWLRSRAWALTRLHSRPTWRCGYLERRSFSTTPSRHFGHLDIVCSNSGVITNFGHLEGRHRRGIRPRLQPQHAMAVLRRARGLSMPRGGRPNYPHLVQYVQDFSVPNHSLSLWFQGVLSIPSSEYFPGTAAIRKSPSTAVTPGSTVTDMFHAVSQHYIPNGDKYTPEQRQEMAAHASPLHRNGFPEDVARVVGFLASKRPNGSMGRSSPSMVSAT